MQVSVRDNNVDQAYKVLKKKMQREGVFREIRLRRHYEKPSGRRAREQAESIRRIRKMVRRAAKRDVSQASGRMPRRFTTVAPHRSEGDPADVRSADVGTPGSRETGFDSGGPPSP